MSLHIRKNIFDIPELVQLIYVYLTPGDSACLARSNNQLFQVVMPLLWEHVDGVSQLLILLPVLNDTNEGENGGQAPEKTLTENNLSRFNVYALWIKHLEVCRDRKLLPSDYRVDALCRYSTTHVLLPNLKSITSTNVEGSADVTWVLPFLSPSLISLEFVITSFGRIPELCPLESLVLLHLLATKCPTLRTLSMVVNADEVSSDPHALQYLSEDDKTKVTGQLPLGLSPFITSIRPLVNLTASAEILDSVCFRIISTWPSLRSLTIIMDQLESDYTPPELDDNSFPALKHLGLYGIHDLDTFRRIWSSPALTEKLTSVKLLPSSEFCYYSNTEFSDTLAQVLSVLAEHSPYLQYLWLRVLHPEALHPFYGVSLTVLDVLQELPLQTLYIAGIYFNDYRFYQHTEAYTDKFVAKRNAFIKHFATSFPALKELGFPFHRMFWTDSPMFHSQMPQLESLHFDFDLWSLRQKEVDLNDIPRYRQSPFRILGANFLGVCENGMEDDITGFQHENAVRLANYLFSVWPNVQIAALPDQEEFEDRTHYKMIALINDHLAALSRCNRDASIKYEDVTILNEDSWAKC